MMRVSKRASFTKPSFSIYKTYFKLKDASITVYSVNTDAFTIKAEEQKAREIVDSRKIKSEAGE